MEKKKLKVVIFISKVKVSQSCPTLCDPMDYTVHEILQARILEWAAFPFSKESSPLRDQTQVSCFAGRFFISWVTRKVIYKLGINTLLSWKTNFCNFTLKCLLCRVFYKLGVGGIFHQYCELVCNIFLNVFI